MAVVVTLLLHALQRRHSQLFSLGVDALVVERSSACILMLPSSSSVASLGACLSVESEPGHVVVSSWPPSPSEPCSSPSAASSVPSSCMFHHVGSSRVRSTGLQLRIRLSHSGLVLGPCSLPKVGRAGIAGRFLTSPSVARLWRDSSSSSASLVYSSLQRWLQKRRCQCSAVMLVVIGGLAHLRQRGTRVGSRHRIIQSSA